jgi:hypothetical protein
MTVGNLFGSNLFNVNILAVGDFFYTNGPLLNYISGDHVVSVIGTMAMTAVAIVGLTFRSARKRPFPLLGYHGHRSALWSYRFSATSRRLEFIKILLRVSARQFSRPFPAVNLLSSWINR